LVIAVGASCGRMSVTWASAQVTAQESATKAIA